MSEAESLVEYLATHDVACVKCDYNLRGIKHLKCPECGHEPDFEQILRRARTKDEGAAIYTKDSETIDSGLYIKVALKLLAYFVIGIVVIIILAIVLPAVLPTGPSTHPMLP
jgi:predicted RNA-binding Zn-ribbon protein involved in translation (DUF1610 family)